MKDSFSINDLALITGLSTRTLRNYLAAGVLKGEKVDGVWTFTDEEVNAFTQNKAVQPSIRAKKNALVFDFMGAKPYNGDKMCVILDLPSQAEIVTAPMFFCQRISAYAPEAELHFAADPLGSGVRLILSGSPRDVMDLLNQYYQQT